MKTTIGSVLVLVLLAHSLSGAAGTPLTKPAATTTSKAVATTSASAPASKPTASKLDFRIAPVAKTDGAKGLTLTEKEITAYTNDLYTNGPAAGLKQDDAYVWLPAENSDQTWSLISTSYKGKTYVLLANRPDHVMLADSRLWSLVRVGEAVSADGRPQVTVKFDDAGGKLFGALTETHIGQPLAVAVDGTVVFAPVINSKIATDCVIDGNFSAEQVKDMANALRAGMVTGKKATTTTSKPGPASKPKP